MSAATDRSGAEDCVTNGKDGFVIPARRVEELAEAIAWCFHHRLELPGMGVAARNKSSGNLHGLTTKRGIALYRLLAASSQAAAQHTAALS